MIRYSDHEQKESGEEQYTETLSPPLFLLITLILTHGIELATDGPKIRATTDAARIIVASDENLIVARAFLFGLLPLFAARRYLVASNRAMERSNLRPPFYGQCYLAAIYALALALSINVATQVSGWLSALGASGIVLATFWYLAVQSLQYKRSLATSATKAFIHALRAFLQAVIIALALTYAAFGDW